MGASAHAVEPCSITLGLMTTQAGWASVSMNAPKGEDSFTTIV